MSKKTRNFTSISVYKICRTLYSSFGQASHFLLYEQLKYEKKIFSKNSLKFGYKRISINNILLKIH